jgi:hypothetical protein
MPRPARLPIAALLASALAASSSVPALGQAVSSTWRVAGGEAAVSNGETGFGVACRSGSGSGGMAGPAMTFEPAPGADLGESFEARLQISTAADAYRIDGVTRIDTSVWRFDRQGSRYMAVEPAEPGADLAATLDNLRAGMNLVIGAAAFDRAQRYSLVGSNRAIQAVLADCPSPSR